MRLPFRLISLMFLGLAPFPWQSAAAQEVAEPAPDAPADKAAEEAAAGPGEAPGDLPDIPESPDIPEIPDIAVPWPDLDAFPPAEGRSDRRRFANRTLRYSVRTEGLDAVGLEGQFKSLSSLIAERNGGALAAQINRRARSDADLIRRLLASEGYYAATVDITLAPVADEDGRVDVTLTVTPGPRYTFSDIRLQFPRATDKATRAAVRELFPLFEGDPIVATRVEAAEAELRLKLPQRGYPFAEVGVRQVLIDDLEYTGLYTLPVTPGPPSVYGDIRITGDRLFDEDHLNVLARFRSGDPYDSRDVEDLRQALIATGLFSSVALRPVLTDQRTDNGLAVVDMEVETTKGPQRRLAARGGYATGEGIKLEGEWTHRNLFPPEGAFTARAVAGTKEQRLGAEVRRSNAGKRGRSMFLLTEALRENRDAYSAYALRGAVGLLREPDIGLGRRWGYAVGAELLATNQRDRSLFADEGDENGKRRTFLIAALPTRLEYDGSNDLFNPTRGFRAAVQATPEAALQNGFYGYTRLRLDTSGYLPLSGDNLVLAGRVALGSILGADRDRIAPSRRFYAGGGGSVRGFGYWELGPQDADGDPLGGRSLTEVSTELRYRFGDYGIVAFVDAGQVYTNALPQFSDLRYGAGLGARYYTAFGPLRFDIARAIDRRPGDPKFAVYISIGQAF